MLLALLAAAEAVSLFMVIAFQEVSRLASEQKLLIPVSRYIEDLHSSHKRVCHRVNVTLGPKEERPLMTGMHTVADIYCTSCNTVLGWKYVSTHCLRLLAHIPYSSSFAVALYKEVGMADKHSRKASSLWRRPR